MMRAGSVLAFLICSALLMFAPDSRAQPGLNYYGFSNDLALSNDGSIVAFSWDGKIGLFDWRGGELKTILLPAGIRLMGGPSFSTNGKSLAASVISEAGNIAIFDLATLQMTALHKSDCWLGSPPVFQPDDGAVLFTTGSLSLAFSLCLYDFHERTTTRVLAAEDGFHAILSPVFLARDTVLFVGVGPRSPTVAAAVETLGVRRGTASIPYRLRLGSLPEIAYPELVRKEVTLQAGGGDEPMSFAASRNGERIVFIDRSLDGEDRVRKTPRGPFHNDLFVIEAGTVRQVTHNDAYLANQAISYDGTIAAFATFATPSTGPAFSPAYTSAAPRIVEVSIVDLRTGAVTRTGLVDRVNADPHFRRNSR